MFEGKEGEGEGGRMGGSWAGRVMRCEKASEEVIGAGK